MKFLVITLFCYLLNVIVVSTSSSSSSSSSNSSSRGEFSWDPFVDEDWYGKSNANNVMVPLTLIPSAASTGAVCLDGSVPGYHLHRGNGAGANSWLVHFEGGGWCNTISSCNFRKGSAHGSSLHMEKQLPFAGILSNKPEENPDFFNWNRVMLRYCDGGSFKGDNQHEGSKSYFRGQKIYEAFMEELKGKGMRYARQVLLSGGSAGGLASILHCDEFRALFPLHVKVKCLSDAGLFLDAFDVSGTRFMRNLYEGVVKVHAVYKNLPQACMHHNDPTSCFFPQNLIANIKTPLFLLNPAYDTWQVACSLITKSADPTDSWKACKSNHTYCSTRQIFFSKVRLSHNDLSHFRMQMLRTIEVFSKDAKNGAFINSCFHHSQSERIDMWFGPNTPHILNKGIAESVGDWYFDRAGQKITINCPFPCDRTCHNQLLR